MKKAYIFRIALLLLVIILPLSRLNTEINAISNIDNKYLTALPKISDGFSNFMNQMDDYLTERLGGRARLIQLNGLINDKLFGYLEHANYEYGKDGYVFLKLQPFERDFEFIDDFTDFLLEIQTYCHDRNVPFVYNLNPAKWSIYTEYLPNGYHYSNDRLAYLQSQLVDKGIVFVDSGVLLRSLAKDEPVFNRQYDAGHWNALGAFYSVNQLLEKMSEFEPSIQPNNVNDFEIKEELKTTLPTSNILIHEYVPVISSIKKNWNYVDMEIRDEIVLSPQHRAFYRTSSQVNNQVELLMFHGSGYNSLGHPFIASAVKSYQGIHNYQNLIDFDYYFNLFRPNFVVVNTAEQVTKANYFNVERMKAKRLNRVLDPSLYQLSAMTIPSPEIVQHEHVTTVKFSQLDIDYGYFANDNSVFDLVADDENNWYFSAFHSDLNSEENSLYLSLKTGEKIRVDLRLFP